MIGCEQFGNPGEFGFLPASRGRILEQEERLAGKVRAGGLSLDQFRDGGSSRDQVDHGEKGRADEVAAEAPGEVRDAIEGDQRGAEQGGFRGNGATGGQGEIGGRQQVPGLIHNYLDGCTGDLVIEKMRADRAGGTDDETGIR